jgi:hypothetical protein
MNPDRNMLSAVDIQKVAETLGLKLRKKGVFAFRAPVKGIVRVESCEGLGAEAPGGPPRWHAEIGTDEMVEHRYLTDEFLVEQTEWSPGRAVVVNFADEDRSADGVHVPAHEYVSRD